MKLKKKLQAHPLKARCVLACVDSNGPQGKPSEWHFDAETGHYHRFQGENHLRTIHGEHLPNPHLMVQNRTDTLLAVIKHVSADKIEHLAGIAVAQKKDPGQAIIDHFTPRLKPAAATFELWHHWEQHQKELAAIAAAQEAQDA